MTSVGDGARRRGEANLILWLNRAATLVFGLSGGLAAVRARLDVFGVLVLAAVVWCGPAQATILGAITGIGGGILRDVLLREVPTEDPDV